MRTILSLFRRDERASGAIEMVLIMPLLFWAYAGTFMFYDAFRAKNNALRASYTISDAISREIDEINGKYLNSMHQMLNFLSASPNTTRMRVTIVCYDDKKKRYTRAWSQVRGGGGLKPHNNGTLHSDMRAHLPIMPDGDQVVLVETYVDYRPVFDAVVAEQTFSNVVVTRPRYTNQVKWSGKSGWVCGR
ncbi:MAG: TadE/TadG family type IV pilus assembly protein [Shimia sp.]